MINLAAQSIQILKNMTLYYYNILGSSVSSSCPIAATHSACPTTSTACYTREVTQLLTYLLKSINLSARPSIPYGLQLETKILVNVPKSRTTRVPIFSLKDQRSDGRLHNMLSIGRRLQGWPSMN